MKPTEFYKFQMAADDDGGKNAAELLIFAPIGEDFFSESISAQAFAEDLGKLPDTVKRLDIHINSPGGSVFDAQAIHSRLADHKSTKNVYIDGLAASAATLIAMVGHKIFMRANATMMIHMPSGIVMGNAKDMRHTASALDTVTESMINIYEKRTGKSRDDIRSMLDAETWFTPDDAVEHGFADEVRGVVKAAASLGNKRYSFNGHVFDLSNYQHIPAFNATSSKHTNMNTHVRANAGGGGEPTDNEPTPTPAPAAPAPTPTPAPGPVPAPAAPVAPVPPVAPANDYDKGIKAERDRITALQRFDRPATHAIVEAAIKDGRTAADISEECFTALEKAGQNTATQGARHADSRQLNGIPAADAGADNENNEGFGALITSKVKARMKQRVPNVHARN